jgi:hypothetical protein
MNVSKTGSKTEIFSKSQILSPFVLLAFLLLPTAVHAQGAAPGMSDVQEVVVQYVHFTTPKAADICGLERETLTNTINKTLTDNAVPAFSVANAKPPMMGVARIELVPEISTISNQSLDCTSWVSLTAQTQSNVRIPPVEVLRNVKIVYWQQGILVPSSQSTHVDQVNDFLTKMAQQFAQQYRMDQPPALPRSSKQ